MKTPSSVQQIIILDRRLSWILIKERGPKFIEKLDQENHLRKWAIIHLLLFSFQAVDNDNCAQGSLN